MLPYQHERFMYSSKNKSKAKLIYDSYILKKLIYDTITNIFKVQSNHLDGGPVVRVWDQEVYSLCGLRFKPCGCSYDDHWRLTWSLTSGPVGLVEVSASWPGHPR